MNTTLAIVWPGRSGSSGAGVLASDNRNFLPLRGAAKACDATASDAAHACVTARGTQPSAATGRRPRALPTRHADVASAQRVARCGQGVFAPALVDAAHSARSRRAIAVFSRL